MILAIDPGLKGAFAVRGIDSIIFESMPLKDGQLDLREIIRILGSWKHHVTYTLLEMQSIRSGQGGQFKIGRNFGMLEAALMISEIPFKIVHPAKWSAAYPHGVTETNHAVRGKLIKKARAKIAARLYPGIDLRRTDRCKVPDEGIVDALLMADFAWNQTKGIRK